MKFNLQLSHKGIILVSVPLILELVFIAILSVLLHQAEVEVQRQIRSKAIISQANALSKLFYDAGVAMGGYSITKSPLFSDRYDKIVRQIPEDLTELKQLVGDNPHQQQILKNLAVITETGLKILGEAKGAIDDNQVDVAQFRARHMYKEIRSLADRLQEELHGLTEDEQKIANQSPEASNRSRSMVKYYLVVGVIFNVLLAFGLAAFFSREITRRLGVLTDNSMRLARGDPLLPLLGGADEIALLDETFHSMADALTEASRKNAAIIENAVDVICSIDVDGKFIAVSPSSRNTWGFEPEELMGRRFIELVLPADHQETIRAVRAVRAERGTMNFENRTRRKDGGLVTILWSTFWSETERSMFCVAHDISQRKAAEEAIKDNERRIRQIIENMLVGLIIITRDGIIESINPASARMFGYQAEELIGHHIMTVFHDSKLFSVHDATDRANFMQTLLNSSYNRIGELDALKKVGEHFPIEMQLSDLETVDGPKLLANILDVSERKEVERLKKEFVSTVSHELRTPLTSIRGSLTLLSVGAMGVLPEQAKKVVGIAERNTIRLITLINDILDIEKLESGKLDMVFDNLAIGTVLERSSESVKAFAEQNGIKLELVPSNAQVYADGDRLVQVLVNLVSNAVKFSPKGETVTVAVEELPNYLEVKVIDRGRGIPAKFKNLLFQRFQQVEASDAKKKGGTGLGLAICKGIIEAHGGTIGVESEEGKGSVFWFRIPPASRGVALLANGPAPAGKTVSANVDEKLGMPALPAPPVAGHVLNTASAPPAMAMAAGQGNMTGAMNLQNTQGGGPGGYGAQGGQGNMAGQRPGSMTQGQNMTQGGGTPGQGMPGQMGGQGMPGQGMSGQSIAAQSMTGAGQPYQGSQNMTQGQGIPGQGHGIQGQPNFNQNATQGNQTQGGGYQQQAQQPGGQTGSYPSTQSQNPYNTSSQGQPNYNQNNPQNFAQTGQQTSQQNSQQNTQAPQGYTYGLPAGQPNQNVPPQTGYQQTRTDSYPAQPAGGYPFAANAQPGNGAPGNGAPGNGSPSPQYDNRNATGQSFANNNNNNTGSGYINASLPQSNPAEWTQEFSRPYPQRPPQAPNGNPQAMPNNMTGGNNARQSADMNMMAAGGAGWIPPEQLGQHQQPQPNQYGQQAQNQWANDPNQPQDGTGARPAAGRIPSPQDGKNRPPAKEEKLV